MAEADIASLDDSQGNDCSLVAYLLKSKGLHKLYYVFRLGLESFINVWLHLNFPGVEVFDHLVSKIITNKQIYAQKTKIFSFKKLSYLPQRGNWRLSKRVWVSKMFYNFIKRFTYTLKTIKIKKRQ